MQINNKINITLQTSHPSMTSFWAAQHWHGNTNQPLRQTEWLNATFSSSFSPSPSLYHTHTVCLSLAPLCHFSCTLSPIFSSHIYFLTLRHFVRPMLAFSPIHFPLYFQSSLHFKCLLFISVIINLETFRMTICSVFVFEWIMMWWEIFCHWGSNASQTTCDISFHPGLGVWGPIWH